MLNRCSPRSRTSAVSANGSASTSAAPSLPVKNDTSSWSVPRATVPSTSGRALEPFLKNTLSRSGIAFGELCMSCRQPVAASSNAASTRPDFGRRASDIGLRLNFVHLGGIEPLEEVGGRRAIEFRVLRLHDQEKPIAARAL